MHYAAYKGNAAVVEYLISKGGDPNARGRHDSTPLHSAAWGRNRQVLEILLENGADVNARTDEGETPGMTASLRGEKEPSPPIPMPRTSTAPVSPSSRPQADTNESSTCCDRLALK
jgi:hypothetical protein